MKKIKAFKILEKYSPEIQQAFQDILKEFPEYQKSLHEKQLLLRKSDDYPWYKIYLNLLDRHSITQEDLKIYEKNVDNLFSLFEGFKKEIISYSYPYRVRFTHNQLTVYLEFPGEFGVQVSILAGNTELKSQYISLANLYPLEEILSKIGEIKEKREEIKEKILKEYPSEIDKIESEFTSYSSKPLYHFTVDPNKIIYLIKSKEDLRLHREIGIRGLSTTYDPIAPTKTLRYKNWKVTLVPTKPLKIFELNLESYRFLRNIRQLFIDEIKAEEGEQQEELIRIESALKEKDYDAIHIHPGTFIEEEKEILLLSLDNVKIGAIDPSEEVKEKVEWSSNLAKEIANTQENLKRLKELYPDVFVKLSSQLDKIAQLILREKRMKLSQQLIKIADILKSRILL